MGFAFCCADIKSDSVLFLEGFNRGYWKLEKFQRRDMKAQNESENQMATRKKIEREKRKYLYSVVWHVKAIKYFL